MSDITPPVGMLVLLLYIQYVTNVNIVSTFNTYALLDLTVLHI